MAMTLRLPSTTPWADVMGQITADWSHLHDDQRPSCRLYGRAVLRDYITRPVGFILSLSLLLRSPKLCSHEGTTRLTRTQEYVQGCSADCGQEPGEFAASTTLPRWRTVPPRNASPSSVARDVPVTLFIITSLLSGQLQTNLRRNHLQDYPPNVLLLVH